MTIIMNESMQADSKFARMLNVVLPRTIANPEDENDIATADWHSYVKLLTQTQLQAEDRSLTPNVFCTENDSGILPFVYQGQCLALSSPASNANYLMTLPSYDEETAQNTPVIKELTDKFLADGIYLPFLMFIDLDDYKQVTEAAKNDQDLYTVLVAELTSKARGENLTDFYVVSMNVSELISRLEFKEEDFDNAESLRVVYPMLMSALANEITSPYPQEIFQSSIYFQNIDPIGEEEIPDVDE